jgi:hypothetical protein
MSPVVSRWPACLSSACRPSCSHSRRVGDFGNRPGPGAISGAFVCVRVRVRACMRACSLLLYGWGIVDRGVGKKGKSYGLIEIDETETGHLFVVGSLDKHIQNKKELVRLRRELPDEPGARNFACGANYPRTQHQALKGSYSVYLCVASFTYGCCGLPKRYERWGVAERGGLRSVFLNTRYQVVGLKVGVPT